jgi:hypothetical protein
MTRFALLQNRYQTAAIGAGLLVVALVAAITGPHLSHLYASYVSTCRSRSDCGTTVSTFVRNDSVLFHLLGLALLFLPGIVGVFWGAPLVAREMESGTYRLAWTQSVTRRRWLATRLAVAGSVVVVLTGLSSLAVTWWARPLDLANADQFWTFDQRDLVPIGYAAFGFALGVTLGLFIRRAVPAMAATFASFIAVRFAFETWVRPHLAPVTHSSGALSGSVNVGFSQGPNGVTLAIGPPHIPNADVLSAQVLSAAGHPASAAALHRLIDKYCPQVAHPAFGGGPGAVPASGPAAVAFHNCLTRLSGNYHEVLSYIKPSHYWSMQWYETGLFFAAALALAGLSFVLIRRVAS